MVAVLLAVVVDNNADFDSFENKAKEQRKRGTAMKETFSSFSGYSRTVTKPILGFLWAPNKEAPCMLGLLIGLCQTRQIGRIGYQHGVFVDAKLFF